MRIGVPRERKRHEARVALTPLGTRELTARGHRVLVERHAGVGSSISDAEYEQAGAEIVPTASEAFAEAELILKVKEPQPDEVALLRDDQVLFTFLHLAAYPEIADGLCRCGATAIAYETVEAADGSLPLLAPMSDIAGRMAAQVGAHYLEQPQGGRGVLISGAPGVPPAQATVLGAGRAGTNAAVALAGMGAQVNVLDIDTEKLGRIEARGLRNITTVYSSIQAIEHYVGTCDLTIGAVLLVGAAAPVLVDDDLVRRMRRGSLLVDISIDQGGVFATSRETTHDDPVYRMHDVLHYAVGNIPGAVPHTSTYALTNATLRYVLALAGGLPAAVQESAPLRRGVNVVGGQITHPAVAQALGRPYVPVEDTLGTTSRAHSPATAT